MSADFVYLTRPNRILLLVSSDWALQELARTSTFSNHFATARSDHMVRDPGVGYRIVGSGTPP